MQLDHKNGDSSDHLKDNLRLLCPNCHSQTDTWCGKNKPQESIMKKKKTPQPRNYLVKLALFRKAGSHKKSNKAIRRLEKSKKNYYSEVYCSQDLLLA